MKSEFKITNKADTDEAEVFIYGEIGAEFWGDEVSAKTFVDQLNALPDSVKTIRVRINSPGGSVWDGYTMYSALTSHPATIITEVDGLAASAASLVAMAGNTRRMGEASMLMMHRASGGVMGDANEVRDYANLLDKIDGQITEVYSRRSGKPIAGVAALLAAETWFTGPEAVEAGFADEVTEQLATAARWEVGKFRNAPSPGGTLVPEAFESLIEEPIIPKPDNNIANISRRLKLAELET
jgi:ATP-dependent Clp protease, protease subunit